MIKQLITITLAALLTGCINLSLPKGDAFADSMLQPEKPDDAVLIIYSISEHWSASATYKFILIDDQHLSTITQDTFARLSVSPGMRSIRIIQHGFEGPELPWFISGSGAMPFGKTIEIDLLPNSVHFIAFDWGRRTIQFQCKETDDAIQICSREVEGVFLKVVDKETAVKTLSTLHEVCHECE